MECGEKSYSTSLLRGMLVNIFIELDKNIRADLTELKKVLMSKAGLTKYWLPSGQKKFIAQIEQEGETVNTFTGDLKLLFS